MAASNLSVLDGWWEETFDPEAGWAIGDGAAPAEAECDGADAAALYDILENEAAPDFYARDARNLPRRWLARIRCSLSRLMLHEHLERLYLPAAAEFRRRTADNGVVAVAMRDWECRLRRAWPRLRISDPTIGRNAGAWQFSVPIELGDIGADEVRVELYAEPQGAGPPFVGAMERGAAIAGSSNGHLYLGTAAATRPARDYTIRVTPAYDGVHIPAELGLISWQK